MTTQLGLLLRDKALAQSAEGRQERIAMVREWLLDHFWGGMGNPTMTADDVHDAVDALGLGEGDTRWTANILRHWKVSGNLVVVPTAEFVASRRPSRSAAPTRVWRWV